MRENISQLISNTCTQGFGAFMASARHIEFLEACMKLTDSRENRTMTLGEVKTDIKSRRTELIMLRHSILDRIGTDLRSAELYVSERANRNLTFRLRYPSRTVCKML